MIGGDGFKVVKPCRERHNECNAEIRRLNPRTSEAKDSDSERKREREREREGESARERRFKAEMERRVNGRMACIYSPTFSTDPPSFMKLFSRRA